MNNKYHAKKIIVNGISYASKKEYKRHCELLLMEKAGVIQELEFQRKFVLIPAQREESTEVYTKGPKKGEPKPGKVVEKECAYFADFCYKKNGNLVVEDTKSKATKTKDYIIKRKLMRYLLGIAIKEV